MMTKMKTMLNVKKITKMLKTTVNWRHINKNDVDIFSHNQ